MLVVGLSIITLSIIFIVIIDTKLSISRALSIDIPNRKFYQIIHKAQDVIFIIGVILCCIHNIFVGISLFFIGIILAYGTSSQITKIVINRRKKSTHIEKPITGGNGKTLEQAVILNCSSPSTVNMLIEKFISELHGKIDVDWSLSSSIITSDNKNQPNFKKVEIETVDGKCEEYYFDISKSIGFIKNLIKINQDNTPVKSDVKISAVNAINEWFNELFKVFEKSVGGFNSSGINIVTVHFEFVVYLSFIFDFIAVQNKHSNEGRKLLSETIVEYWSKKFNKNMASIYNSRHNEYYNVYKELKQSGNQSNLMGALWERYLFFFNSYSHLEHPQENAPILLKGVFEQFESSLQLTEGYTSFLSLYIGKLKELFRTTNNIADANYNEIKDTLTTNDN
jgi:hypothetical protein